MYWKKLSKEEINKRVFEGLDENLNYDRDAIMGIPGTYLDTKEFYRDEPFLKNAPFLSTLINNPNHIGCHTLNGDLSEEIFRGTQKIEIDLLNLIGEEILRSERGGTDGYVAPGGTEANIQAMWLYRNYYIHDFDAKNEEIAVVYSADSHYSMPKGANILNINTICVDVDESTRQMKSDDLETKLAAAKAQGLKYLIVVLNMSTTMFGSVDDIDAILPTIKASGLPYKIHVDGAFGGFMYPFTSKNNKLDFHNPEVTSVTLDAHKMLQAPYGTGIFMVRKGWMEYGRTKEAQYVPGTDYTICGSRNGANAISIWMILMIYGYEEWKSKMMEMIALTDYLTSALDGLGVSYFREPEMNIVTINANDVPEEVAMKYRLVADSYEHQPKWQKIVVMNHVKKDLIDAFIQSLTAARANQK